jgi:hypothetical protein
VSDQELPEEVAHDLSRYLDGAKPARVAFYDKKLSRVEAWFQTTKLTPGAPINPWRKCHTKNYWVWYIPAEES